MRGSLLKEVAAVGEKEEVTHGSLDPEGQGEDRGLEGWEHVRCWIGPHRAATPVPATGQGPQRSRRTHSPARKPAVQEPCPPGQDGTYVNSSIRSPWGAGAASRTIQAYLLKDHLFP